MTQDKKHVEREQHKQHKLSLFPLDVEDALLGAMATGKPAEPERKRAKQGTKLREKGKEKGRRGKE